MRRLLILAALLPITTAAIFLGLTTPLFATSCTTTCQVTTLSCTPVSSCTSVPATSLNCDGTVTTCSAADAWCNCTADCAETCDFACSLGPGACGICVRNCHCGSAPPNTMCHL